MQYRVDLHTHSSASPDGALEVRHYKRMFDSKQLDSIAVTDHDTTDMALALRAELGDRIIVGQEITTLEGEIIGLYLQHTVPARLSAAETVRHIHEQGGLVYIPHPFETVRKGIDSVTLDRIAQDVDIIEVHNGRAVFQNKTKKAATWSDAHKVPRAASSDAHGMAGWGKTCTVLSAKPTRDTLVALLRNATYTVGFPGLQGMAYPTLNRLRKRHGSVS